MATVLQQLHQMDLKTLKGLVQLKQNRKLAQLESRRTALSEQLQGIEQQITKILRKNPAARELLATTTVGNPVKGTGRKKGRVVRRQGKTMQAVGTGAAPSARKTAKRKKTGKGKSKGGAGSRQPAGWLRDQIIGVLKAAGEPMSPTQIRDVILSKHPRDNTKSFYVTVVQQLGRHKQFQKTAKGWALR